MTYATSRAVAHIKDCRFHHSMELPRVGLVEGYWDLRDVIDDYLRGLDVRGKRGR